MRKNIQLTEREPTKNEALRLVQAAHEQGELRPELVLETICTTGIRTGELKYSFFPVNM